MSQLNIGDEYIHKNTGGHYVVSEFLQTKINGVWIDCVIYKNLESGIRWCRPVDNFKEKFYKKDG